MAAQFGFLPYDVWKVQLYERREVHWFAASMLHLFGFGLVIRILTLLTFVARNYSIKDVLKDGLRWLWKRCQAGVCASRRHLWLWKRSQAGVRPQKENESAGVSVKSRPRLTLEDRIEVESVPSRPDRPDVNAWSSLNAHQSAL